MFKRLRERISEEASKSVAQLGNNAIKTSSESENKVASGNSSEDLITLSESSSVVMPHTSSQQFSIGEDDEGSMSEQSTPQKNVDASNGSTPYSTPSSVGTDFSFSQEYRPKRLSYIPQSDIESEREDPPTLNLEGISKDQLLDVIDLLKARTYKYKNKYSEVVKNFKELRDEKLKIEKTLIDTQDKGSRRIAELREQCQLEQKAKAHLEANLRLMLEEKDNRISVLETQNNLLKDTDKSENSSHTDSDRQSLKSADLLTGDSTSTSPDSSDWQEKFERLEHQFNQAKKTITAQTDQITLLRKQNENLSQELEGKVKRVNELEDQQTNLKQEHESILKSMQIRLEELEEQQEESAMAMAETKKNMHEELELKDKQLVKAKTEAGHHQSAVESEKRKVADLQKHYEDKINELQRQLESTEKTLEDEKQNLMQELNRGKTAAIALMQKDCAQKISAVEEEWKAKLQQLQSQLSEASDEGKSISKMKEKLNQSEIQVKEVNSLVLQLEKENDSLKSSIEKLKSINSDTKHEESIKCLKDKYGNAEKNYATQMDEMKQRIIILEKEKQALEEENKNFLKVQEELLEKKSKLKSQKEEMRKIKCSFSENVEKTERMQEKVKHQESTVLELEAALKEKSEILETVKKNIKLLEQEREQLMHEAQERVSATEAKCRDDLKLLQEKNCKLSAGNKEIEHLRSKIILLEKNLQENLLFIETLKAESSEGVLDLKRQLSETEAKLFNVEAEKQATVNELLEKIQKFEEDNSQLLNKATLLEDLKSEKEVLNEKLKQAELETSSLNDLETERDNLKSENASLLEQLQLLETSMSDQELLTSQIRSLEETIENCTNTSKLSEKENEKLKGEIGELKKSLDKEVTSLKAKNESLSKQIDLLEKLDSSDPSSVHVKNYISSVRQDCEKAIKAKEEDMETKLKLLVRDFAEQMDIKDRDCDKITSEILERNHDLEERLIREHRNEIVELRQSLFEKECALDDIRDDYEVKLQEKDKKIKEYESIVKNLSSSESGISHDSAMLTAESSDWDDTWAVPEETTENNTSPAISKNQCNEHVQEIETLKDELSKCNSEIKELKVLLRLSPPESMVNNNNRRDSLQSIPEPTEFEYLKNIIYEYMMGKEPITLVKVIAAVLRFSEAQTQQVIRKEESRHQTK